ncbi:MAG TPA: acyltransferase family protein [Trebonia sp.]|nr:acyltransferase family protein [Trebonia sp.]
MSVQERPLPASEVTGQTGEQPREIAKGRGFRPDIQGMRALAVAMVVIYHLHPSWLPGGFAGVDVFFVISGFLITGHLLREYQKTRRVHLLAFWGRRAKRLVPAAALVLTVTWLLSRLVLPVTRLADTAAQIRASALYYQNWQLAWNAVDYLKSADAASPVQHFWSLSVEEQFYLGWPLLFLLAAVVGLTARRGSRPARGHLAAFALAGAVVAGSLWYSVYDTNANPAGAYFVTTTRIWELGLGGLLALLPVAVTRRAARLGPIGWAGLGLVIASAFVLSGTTAFPGVLALLPAGGAALLILGGSAEGRFGPHRLTSTRPMVFTGGISYSLYLWHWPLIVLWMSWSGRAINLASGAGIVVVAVALSWLTKVWVEDRVRTASLFAGHNWRSVSTAFAAAVPVLLVSLFIATEPHPWDGKLGPGYPGAAMLADKIIAVEPAPVLPPPAALQLPAYWQQGCLVPAASPTPKECDYGDVSHPRLTVALVGDSMAGDWFTPLQAIAAKRHWLLVTDLHAVCPLSSAMLITPDVGGPYTPCHAWGKAVVHDLVTRIRPDVVITSDYPGLATVRHPEGGRPSAVEIGKGMAKYWRQLEHHGISVVAIKESPIVGRNIPECVSQNPADPSVCDVPTAKAIRRNLPTVFAARASRGKVPLIDMNPLICGPVDCPPVVGNVLVYQDSHHLTSTYALTTAPYLERRLLRVSKTLAKRS